MERVLYADIERCLGCQSCEVACRQEHDVPTGEWYIRIITVEPEREEDLRGLYFFPVLSDKCRRCRDVLSPDGEPVCVSSCPTRCLRFAEMNTLNHVIGQRKPLIVLKTFL